MKRLLLLLALTGCTHEASVISVHFFTPLPARAHFRIFRGVYLNDLKYSPGVVDAAHDTSIICHQSTRQWRHTTDPMKDSVYAEYGIVRPRPNHGEYEVDHIIPLEDGGKDVVKNLQPQPAEPRPGFHEKDQVENWIHVEVCQGRMNLAWAQKQIATNWYLLYLRMQSSSQLEEQ